MRGCQEEMLRLACEESAVIDLHGIPGFHTDSVLPSRPREYARLVRRCVEIGFAGFTLKGARPRGHLFREKRTVTRA